MMSRSSYKDEHSLPRALRHDPEVRLPPLPYAELLRQARRAARRADEVEDLLQTVLVAALEAGRCDLSIPENRRWVHGALRRRSAFDARSAVRRRRRDGVYAEDAREADETDIFPRRFVAGLPAGLRTTALLVLTGHTRPEIAWLQGLNDTAMRQRFAEIRRRWRALQGGALNDPPGLAASLAYGRIRRALLARAKAPGVVLASHDPDGHLFVIATSQNTPSRQRRDAGRQTKE